MTLSDMLALPGADNPILLADGRMGLLRALPTEYDGKAVISVFGEVEYRRICPNEIEASAAGALRQHDSPATPKNELVFDGMVYAQWLRLNGNDIQLHKETA